MAVVNTPPPFINEACCEARKNIIELSSEYITIERSLYNAMVEALHNCRKTLENSIARLHHHIGMEWIDNETAQAILRRNTRSMQTLRSDGQIGYTTIDGKVYYPASEIGRLLERTKYED